MALEGDKMRQYNPSQELRYSGQHPSHRRLELMLGRTMMGTHVYVEAYEVQQYYGGPEEGGWYGHALEPKGPCIPVVAAEVYQGDEHPEYSQNRPEGVCYFVRHDDGSETGAEHWWLYAALSEDLEAAERYLASLGIEEDTDRYGQGTRILESSYPGQHTEGRRRYE